MRTTPGGRTVLLGVGAPKQGSLAGVRCCHAASPLSRSGAPIMVVLPMLPQHRHQQLRLRQHCVPWRAAGGQLLSVAGPSSGLAAARRRRQLAHLPGLHQAPSTSCSARTLRASQIDRQAAGIRGQVMVPDASSRRPADAQQTPFCISCIGRATHFHSQELPAAHSLPGPPRSCRGVSGQAMHAPSS